MILFVVLTCWIGIVAGVDDDKDETVSLGVSEGGNLTISIRMKKSDKDPQVLVTRVKGSSQESIAQLICHNRVCDIKCWRSGVSLISDGENVTLILMNVSYNQTGLYKVSKLSSTPLENKTYNVTMCQPPLRTISPELPPPVMNSKSFTAGVTTAAVAIPVLITAAVVSGGVYWKRRKGSFYKVPQNDDTAASSLCGSLSVTDNY